MKIIKNKKKNKVVFVSMCVDGLHHGHINILKKANKFGKVVVGLMTDTGIKSYKKRKPKITFKNRKKILDEIKLVNKVVPINNLDFVLSQKNMLTFGSMEMIGKKVHNHMRDRD